MSFRAQSFSSFTSSKHLKDQTLSVTTRNNITSLSSQLHRAMSQHFQADQPLDQQIGQISAAKTSEKERENSVNRPRRASLGPVTRKPSSSTQRKDQEVEHYLPSKQFSILSPLMSTTASVEQSRCVSPVKFPSTTRYFPEPNPSTDFTSVESNSNSGESDSSSASVGGANVCSDTINYLVAELVQLSSELRPHPPQNTHHSEARPNITVQKLEHSREHELPALERVVVNQMLTFPDRDRDSAVDLQLDNPQRTAMRKNDASGFQPRRESNSSQIISRSGLSCLGSDNSLAASTAARHIGNSSCWLFLPYIDL